MKRGGIYSNSKLWLFENCPEYYKAKYIDKALPEFPKSVELFLGDLVHQSLEWLYIEVAKGNKIELDDVIEHFSMNWMKSFSDDIRMRWGGAQDYFNKGVKFLVDYYMKNKPFNENTIHVEKQILFPLDDDGKYKITGFIDRIVKNGTTYEVHDYKTNDFMKTKEEVDKDRQLAFYHLGLQEIFGKNIDVKLLWHFLAHNKTIESRRTQAQLETLKKDTLALIGKIEQNEVWNCCGRKWCDWCNWKMLRENGN